MAPQQYFAIPPSFVNLSSLFGNAIFMLVQLGPYSGFYVYIFTSLTSENLRLVRYVAIELVVKTQYPTAIGNIFVIQLFLTHNSCNLL